MRARLAGVGVIACAISVHAQQRNDPVRRDTGKVVPSEPDESANSVEVVVVGDPDQLDEIRGAVAPHDFGDASASWRVEEKFDRRTLLDAGAGKASVRAFILLSPDRADLYFSDRAGERFLVREVRLATGLDAVGREAVSQVLALSVVALLEDHRAGISRSEAERLLVPPRSEAEPEPAAGRSLVMKTRLPARTEAVSAGVFYGVKAFGGGVPLVHGPGVVLAFEISGEHTRTAVWASAQYELPQSYRAADVGVKWSTTLFRGGVQWLTALPGTNLLAGARLGLGADLVDFSPRQGAAASGFVLTAARQATVAVFTPAVKLALPLGERWTATTELFADCHPSDVAFGLERDGAPERVLSPWRVRPGLTLGLMLR
jgi:hypothetical protein